MVSLTDIQTLRLSTFQTEPKYFTFYIQNKAFCNPFQTTFISFCESTQQLPSFGLNIILNFDTSFTRQIEFENLNFSQIYQKNQTREVCGICDWSTLKNCLLFIWLIKCCVWVLCRNCPLCIGFSKATIAIGISKWRISISIISKPHQFTKVSTSDYILHRLD